VENTVNEVSPPRVMGANLLNFESARISARLLLENFRQAA
jgi:hypothetical protein